MAIVNIIQIGIRIRSPTINLSLLGKRKSIGVMRDISKQWTELGESAVHSMVTTHG